MISPENAAELVLKETGYKKLYNVRDYDLSHYVVMAAPNDDKLYKDAQTTFGVDKKTGKVTSFILNGLTIQKFNRSKIVFTK